MATPPRTAYILLWFPKPSETFIFREVINLRNLGLPLKVFSLYGELSGNLSPEMREVSDDVERLGIPFLKVMHADLHYWWKRDRTLTREILRILSIRRWSGLEKTGENLWAFLCAFHLARRFEHERIAHIHAPWASGPATAAWIASRLTGIPFSFTARAWDIFPPDKGLPDKIRDATLIRSETKYNIDYMNRLVSGYADKFHLTYNGVPLKTPRESPVQMNAPLKLLALGRFVGKKGYEYLIRSCKLIQDSGLDFHLTLAGDGPRKGSLERLSQELGIADKVSFPGFVTYDRVSDLFYETDIFLMPSVIDSSGDRDGIPTVIMEALMHRVPVIATDVSGISELIEDRVTGLLIPEKNVSAIAEAIRETATDRQSAVELAERGRERVREQFNPERNHRKVLALYEEHFSPRG